MRAALVALALPFAAPAAAVEVPHYADFRRWLVACDNVRRCEARGFDENTRADLRVLRDAGDAPAEFRFTAAGAPALRAVRIDGAPLRLDRPAWTARREDGVATVSTRDPAAVAAFVRRVRDARLVTFGPAADGGVALDGFVAALLRMDEVQGRAGTPTALVARRGPGRVQPAPPGLPERPRWSPVASLPGAQGRALLADTRRAQAAALADAECEPPEPGVDRDEAHALDARHALALLACSYGAYQAWSLAFVVPRAGGPAARFAPILPTWAEPLGALTSASFDPAAGALGTSHKGRGPADCGFSAEWVWGAGAFRLVALARQDACGGAGPGDWPDLVRTAAPAR